MSKKATPIEMLEKHLEQLNLQFENRYGFKAIINFAESNDHLSNFIPRYQNEIRKRQGEWPYNDSFIPTYDGLIGRFFETSVHYLETATNLFPLLASANPVDIYVAFEKAVFSEAARGREGKRSKIGLDNQQEIMITELTGILQNIWMPEMGDMEEKINIVAQTVLSGHSSAAELPEKFIEFIDTCNEDVTLVNIDEIDANTNGLVGKLLRGFCCYSLSKFNKHLYRYRNQYDKIKAKADNIASKRKEKIQLLEQIGERIIKTGGQPLRFFQLAEQIDTLNYLNDSIDVKYSFKSWPGLIHWNVFANVISITGDELSLIQRANLLSNNKNK